MNAVVDRMGIVTKKLTNVETFFACSFAVSVLTGDNPTLHLAAGILVIAFFFRAKARTVFLLLFLSAWWVGEYATVVVEQLPDRYGEQVYDTTKGKVYAATNMIIIPGDILTGTFTVERSGGDWWDFRKTRYRIEPGFRVTSVHLLNKLAHTRLVLSEYLYLVSGGQITTAQAHLFGDKRFLDNSLRDQFIVSGVAHLFAMSGFHVGLIFSLFYAVFSFLPIKFRNLLGLFVLPLLIPLTGFRITVIRAVLFVVAYMAASLFDLKIDLRRFLLLIAGLFLLGSPSMLSDISFVLSFLAVYGIASLAGKNTGYVKGGLMVGIAATVYTTPVSLFLFGTANYAGIVTTLVLVPVVFLLMVAGMFASVFPAIGVPPVILMEQLQAWLIGHLADLSYPLFLLQKISATVFIGCMLLLAAVSATRFRWAAVLVLLVPFFQTGLPEGTYIPSMRSSKGFIVHTAERNEIFFQGDHFAYSFIMVPLAAKLGIKTFDSGSIIVYSGENHFLRYEEESKEFTGISVNTQTRPLVYITRSNTLKQEDVAPDKQYILYRNGYTADNIIQQKTAGSILIDREGRVKELPDL